MRAPASFALAWSLVATLSACSAPVATTSDGGRTDGARPERPADGHPHGEGAAKTPSLCMVPIATGGGSVVVVDSTGAVCALCPGSPVGWTLLPSLWGVVDCVASCSTCTRPANTGIDGGPFECVGATYSRACTTGDAGSGGLLVNKKTGMTCGLCTGATQCVLPEASSAPGPSYCVTDCTLCEPATSFGH